MHAQGSSADRSQWREPTRTPDCLCSLYEAALCLFEEVRKVFLAILEIRNYNIFLVLTVTDGVVTGLSHGVRLLEDMCESRQHPDGRGSDGV